MTTTQLSHSLSRRLRGAIALVGVSIALGACTHTAEDVTATVPDDYRARHPIVVQESSRAVEIFVGSERGGLTAAQRGDVAALAQSWMREGTGIITVEVPVNAPNARAAADAYREVQSLLAAGGVPPRGIVMRNYRTESPRQFATIRLKYPRIVAEAGPCGVWPEDLGPSVKNKTYLENKPYYNLGCSQQRNLAAMVANPEDLVQPRPEAGTYTARRTVALDKYRQGQTTTTSYPDADKNKISSVGQ
ncbi:pilus assembly protein CpaD [soil metagenome]